MIKADTAPEEPRPWQPWKPITVRGQWRGRKDPSPTPLCDMFPSPARPKGSVSLLTLQTLNIFIKHKGHNCMPSTTASSRNRDMDPSQRSPAAERSMIKQSFVVWLFPRCKNRLLGANWATSLILWNKINCILYVNIKSQMSMRKIFSVK